MPNVDAITEAWLTGKPLLAPRAPATNLCLERLAEAFWALVDAIEVERKAKLKADRAARRRSHTSADLPEAA